MNELKPCPFCGGKAELIDDRTAWYVECTGCQVVVIGVRIQEEQVAELSEKEWDTVRISAIDRWNRRTPPI